MTARQVDWDGLLAALLHPTQMAILTAVDCIGRPLSPSLLEHVFDHTISLALLNYHVNRLAHLGALEKVDSREVRGAIEGLWAPPL